MTLYEILYIEKGVAGGRLFTRNCYQYTVKTYIHTDYINKQYVFLAHTDTAMGGATL